MSRYLDLAKGLIPSRETYAPYEKNEFNEITSPPLTPAEPLPPVPAPPAPPGSLVTLLRVPEGCPEAWCEGITRLLAMPPPSSYSGPVWAVLRDDASEFFWKWSGKAACLGWPTLAVWGVHPTRPQARTDCLGLVAILHGRKITGLDEKAAVIGWLRFYRPEPASDAVPLWNLT